MRFLNNFSITRLFSYPQCIGPDPWRTIEVFLHWFILVQGWPQRGSLTSLVRPAQVAIKVILFRCLLVREADRWWRHKWFSRERRLNIFWHTAAGWTEVKNYQVWKKNSTVELDLSGCWLSGSAWLFGQMCREFYRSIVPWNCRLSDTNSTVLCLLELHIRRSRKV